MKTKGLSNTLYSGVRPSAEVDTSPAEGLSFETALAGAMPVEAKDVNSMTTGEPAREPVAKVAGPPGSVAPVIHPLERSRGALSASEAAAAYARQAPREASAAQPAVPEGLEGMSDLAKYKDDQLLRNPGGDHYDLEKGVVVTDSKDQESFLGRVGKDLSDSFGNIKNFFQNILMGSKIRYRDEHNQIREATQRGMVGSICDFFKDMGSALSLGYWRPDGSEAPTGVAGRLGYVASKIKDAILGDIIHGVSSSVNRMGKNLVLAGWNLVEVVPDATLGNFEGGRKLTTTVFDNGQVAVEYLTDVMPTGEAWFRVHAWSLKELKAPVLYNIRMPESHPEDVRWRYVRNTPFRKTIETVGALLADVTAIGILGQTGPSGRQNKHTD